MTVARFLVGDVFERLAEIPDRSVHCVISSPPYFRQRDYLPAEHPDKAKEIGQETTPAEALETLLRLMDALWPKLADDATYWINLGDKHAGSGGAGGDYDDDGLRAGQPRYGRVDAGDGWPLNQSVCWLPQLFGASLAYGRNLLTGQSHSQWVTRPAVTWCKPNPMPGSTGRKFKTATELIIYGGKHEAHYFDLDAVREPAEIPGDWNQTGPKQRMATDRSDQRTGHARFTKRTVNPNGKAPLNYWVVESEPYPGAHFAVMPSGLVVKPIETGCPRRVCITCGAASERLTAGHTPTNGGDRERDRQGRGRKERSRTDVDEPRHTVGWTTCGCPSTDGLRLDGHHTGDGWQPGVVLDPFAGSGTTLAVATGHGRNAIGIDLDERNAQLARDRLGMFLDIDQPAGVG